MESPLTYLNGTHLWHLFNEFTKLNVFLKAQNITIKVMFGDMQ